MNTRDPPSVEIGRLARIEGSRRATSAISPGARPVSPACGRVFEGTSRDRSCQWCSSSDCGDRDRAREHQRRRRAARG
ncbi:CGNR zinc finger domain-containing protein [Geodermatophilus sp. SYSU D00779]